MKHVVFDGFNAFRSRLDDYLLIHEVLNELPEILGVTSVMPPMLIPYYNGVRAEDCGISSFVFLKGGHITLHTFSYRETLFADIVSTETYSEELFLKTLSSVFPCKVETHQFFQRNGTESFLQPVDSEKDFGPHIFLKFQGRGLLNSFESIFDAFDRLPQEIGMTPIMRPYVLKSNMNNRGESVVSVMTMIAESHIVAHFFQPSNTVYFDLFSCSFFEMDPIITKITEIFGIPVENMGFFSRGKNYAEYRMNNEIHYLNSSRWASMVLGNKCDS